MCLLSGFILLVFTIVICLYQDRKFYKEYDMSSEYVSNAKTCDGQIITCGMTVYRLAGGVITKLIVDDQPLYNQLSWIRVHQPGLGYHEDALCICLYASLDKAQRMSLMAGRITPRSDAEDHKLFIEQFKHKYPRLGRKILKLKNGQKFILPE